MGLDWYHREELCYPCTETPAFEFWDPAPDADAVPSYANRLLWWADGRCAMCGFITTLVEDHDHDTGLVRGPLCRSCNGQEAHSTHPAMILWRQGRNPAAALGLEIAYVSPYPGAGL